MRSHFHVANTYISNFLIFVMLHCIIFVAFPCMYFKDLIQLFSIFFVNEMIVSVTYKLVFALFSNT